MSGHASSEQPKQPSLLWKVWSDADTVHTDLMRADNFMNPLIPGVFCFEADVGGERIQD